MASPTPSEPDPARLARIAAAIRAAPDTAQSEAEDFTRAHPQFAPGWRVLALACAHAGKGDAAHRAEARALTLAAAHPTLAAARAAIAAGQLDRAEPALRHHLREEDPECPLAALLLGRVAQGCEALPEAERLYGRAQILAPGWEEAALALANLRRDTGRHAEAIAALDPLLARTPTPRDPLLLKADLLLQERRLDEAAATLAALTAAHPAVAAGWLKLAHLLKTTGDRAGAIAAYRRAIAVAPEEGDMLGEAWWGLANLKTARLDDDDIAAIRATLAIPDLAPEAAINLHYALGKALDDAARPEQAFAAYAKGATARLALVPHDPGGVDADVERTRATITADFLAARTGWGSPAPDPIFIVSLPRSGSTLVEQILATHPEVEGTEELHDIERIALMIGGGPRGAHWTERVAGLSRTDIRALGEHYIEATRRHRRTDRPFFTDKMPSNWIYAGLIRLILPRARIIDVRRHPLACGWANFTQHFSWGINYSYDLAHIGRFQTSYVRQMAHISKLSPRQVVRLHHEALVDDLEPVVRALLSSLKLPFAPECLRFFENARAVHTPSADQVRQPINRAGLDRWRPYEPWLGPLKQALGPILDHYPQDPPPGGTGPCPPDGAGHSCSSRPSAPAHTMRHTAAKSPASP